jgi:hypothetical protein
MIRQLAEECPGVQPGPAGWFCGGGVSRQAGLINHCLVFGVLVQLSVRKNQPEDNCIYQPVRLHDYLLS